MADFGDAASELTEREIQQSLEEHRRRGNARRLVAVGLCHFCESPLGSGELFCDKDCAEDYELEDRQRRINGG